jgi:EmrB/QacA subfamily drug resistance transporter
MDMQRPDPRRWLALALLCAAQFIVILDTSIIGVALPAIQADLDFTPGGLSWIFNAYVIAFGGLLLLGGKLGDVFGARRIFMLGFAILTGASLLAGLATSQEVLLSGRALQGVGAALIAPTALAIIMRLFAHNGAELGKAFGFWGAAAAAGGTAGVFLGGVITEWLSWPWTFLINVPLGALVFLLAPTVIRYAAPSVGRIDWIGGGTITASLVTAVYAIVTTEPGQWTSVQTLLELGVAALLLGVFLVIQAVRQEPLLPLRIFKAPNLALGNVLMGLMGAAWIPLWFYLNLYLQQTLHLSPLASGLALLPMTLTIMVVMVGLSGKLIGRFGIKANVVVGLLAMGSALILLSQVPANGDYVANVLPASLLAALGMALAYIPVTMAAMSGARPQETGLASGLVNTTYQVGSAVGLAAMVALAAAAGPEGSGEALLGGFHAAFYGAAWVAFAAAALALLFLRGSPATKEVAVG